MNIIKRFKKSKYIDGSIHYVCPYCNRISSFDKFIKTEQCTVKKCPICKNEIQFIW